ncbi:aminotransferase class I/II-fold pyridoxal phosphate-dependent enzyme [Magnetospira sp. QH-2]|uniref:aminotransferase class I/II-fold pyridoxal phosphate-dependent enzyme n=1 Tax=Magnetospira sp. (strain QH-2) TaxID=1288970 RepID=UPI0003E80FA2|nr:aminotransferase class I/II-fold pyridoxal phosphate-dependent enzyme [Magnetospira sp. QH-2]CCQ75426.1 putative aminotransferase [Magnetospira sp. QH-2]
MINQRLDLLNDYPFQRLRDLLDPLDPPDGVTPLVMSIGEPKHSPPDLVADIIQDHRADWNRYPPPAGTPELRQSMAGWLTRRFALPEDLVDPERHLLPLAGTREGLFQAALVCVPQKRPHGPPPVVLTPNPFYQVYAGAGVMAGAETVYLPATGDTGFLPDLDALSADLLTRTAMLYLCSPTNPQGAVADDDYLDRALDLALSYDFVLAMDECYAETYDQTPPPSALQAAARLGGGLSNLLVFHSLSKRSSAPGLRSGFVAGDQDLITLFARLRSYAGATIPMPIMAASAALWDDDAHVADNRARYGEKFDIAERILGDRFGFRRPQGGFFLWLDVGNGEEAAKKLWQQAGLRVLPGAYLARDDESGDNPGASYIRVALVHEPAMVEDALTRLVEVLR